MQILRLASKLANKLGWIELNRDLEMEKILKLQAFLDRDRDRGIDILSDFLDDEIPLENTRKEWDLTPQTELLYLNTFSGLAVNRLYDFWWCETCGKVFPRVNKSDFKEHLYKPGHINYVDEYEELYENKRANYESIF